MIRTAVALTLLVALFVPAACKPARETGLPVASTDSSATTAVITETTGNVDTVAPPEQPAAPAEIAQEKNIYIDSVTVANPVVIAGRARTFENHVSLRVRGADGKLIAEGFTVSRGEMGSHNPYQGTLWLTRDPGKRLIVEALEYSAKDGAETNVARVEKPFNVALVPVSLYFPDRECKQVHAYTRRIPKSVSIARLLVEALVAGPTDAERKAGASHPFPTGSRVESVILREGTVTVDFNDRLRNVGGSCAAQMIRASVDQTLRRLPAIRKVVITAGGSEALALQP